MHLYFFIRGIKQQCDIFVTHAQTFYWRWTRFNLKTKKLENTLVQGALRPSIFGAWEYVFPEEALPEVLAMLGITDNVSYKHLNFSGLKHAVLRKMFGAEKIKKEIFEKAKTIPPTLILKDSCRGLTDMRVNGVAIHVIGIKKDDRGVLFNYEQELL